MATTNAAQLNMGFMYFPTALLAKMPKPKRRAAVKQNDVEDVEKLFGFNQTEEPTQAKNTGAFNFIPKNGKKRYSANSLATLGVINKIRSTFESFGRLPHALFERVLNRAHVTINHSLAKLRTDGIIIRGENGVNDYYINPEFEFSEKDYVTVYEFLLEANDFGGVVKKLNFNAVLLLCFMLREYYRIVKEKTKEGKSKNNIKPEDAYFIAGKQRIASLLNIPESTANDAIWELMDTEAVFRKAFDVNKEKVCDGKGNSGAKQTVLILNSKVIRLCDKVRAKMDAAKKKRTKKAQKAAQKAEPKEERKSSKQRNKKTQKHLSKAEQRQQDYDILQSLYEPEQPEPFEEFTQHDIRPPTDNPTK